MFISLEFSKNFFKERIYPNLPEGLKKKPKSIANLYIDLDPFDWANPSVQIVPYRKK